jgi:hypothetical protein
LNSGSEFSWMAIGLGMHEIPRLLLRRPEAQSEDRLTIGTRWIK